MKKIATSHELQGKLQQLLRLAQEPNPSRKLLARELHKLSHAVAPVGHTSAPAGLKSLVRKIQLDLDQHSSRVTLNKGPDAHADLDTLEKAVNRAMNWLYNAEADYGSEATEEAKQTLDDLSQTITDIQGELDELNFLDDEADEDAVMEFMEDKMVDVDEAIDHLRHVV